MLPPLLPFPLKSVSSLHLLCLSFLSSSPSTLLFLVSTSLYFSFIAGTGFNLSPEEVCSCYPNQKYYYYVESKIELIFIDIIISFFRNYMQ